MKNLKVVVVLFLSVIGLVQLASCGGSSGTPAKVAKPLSEVLRTVFYAQQVKHDGSVVYTKGGTSNAKDDYKKLKMDLTSSSAVSFTDLDGNTFSGNYSLSVDSKTLTFTGLAPAPTGTGGTINFTVVSFTETPASIVLSRSDASAKTGKTTNEYTLTTTP